MKSSSVWTEASASFIRRFSKCLDLVRHVLCLYSDCLDSHHFNVKQKRSARKENRQWQYKEENVYSAFYWSIPWCFHRWIMCMCKSLWLSVAVCVCYDVYVSCLAALLWFDSASHLIYSNEAQTESRPPRGRVSLCVYNNMLAISAAFLLRDQSKLPSPRMPSGKHLQHVYCKLDGVSALTLTQQPLITSHTHTHINTTNADTYRKPHL